MQFSAKAVLIVTVLTASIVAFSPTQVSGQKLRPGGQERLDKSLETTLSGQSIKQAAIARLYINLLLKGEYQESWNMLAPNSSVKSQFTYEKYVQTLSKIFPTRKNKDTALALFYLQEPANSHASTFYQYMLINRKARNSDNSLCDISAHFVSVDATQIGHVVFSIEK